MQHRQDSYYSSGFTQQHDSYYGIDASQQQGPHYDHSTSAYGYGIQPNPIGSSRPGGSTDGDELGNINPLAARDTLSRCMAFPHHHLGGQLRTTPTLCGIASHRHLSTQHHPATFLPGTTSQSHLDRQLHQIPTRGAVCQQHPGRSRQQQQHQTGSPPTGYTVTNNATTVLVNPGLDPFRPFNITKEMRQYLRQQMTLGNTIPRKGKTINPHDATKKPLTSREKDEFRQKLDCVTRWAFLLTHVNIAAADIVSWVFGDRVEVNSVDWDWARTKLMENMRTYKNQTINNMENYVRKIIENDARVLEMSPEEFAGQYLPDAFSPISYFQCFKSMKSHININDSQPLGQWYLKTIWLNVAKSVFKWLKGLTDRQKALDFFDTVALLEDHDDVDINDFQQLTRGYLIKKARKKRNFAETSATYTRAAGPPLKKIATTPEEAHEVTSCDVELAEFDSCSCDADAEDEGMHSDDKRHHVSEDHRRVPSPTEAIRFRESCISKLTVQYHGPSYDETVCQPGISKLPPLYVNPPEPSPPTWLPRYHPSHPPASLPSITASEDLGGSGDEDDADGEAEQKDEFFDEALLNQENNFNSGISQDTGANAFDYDGIELEHATIERVHKRHSPPSSSGHQFIWRGS
ncbi:hypothetical protein EJ03DRAFT_350683 [Teratosphaeria nubilosa]|uniref:Uncharacterized protein n=1 Tax=Teratosphaeria nubilosa TaxID=161662 RepID=A0A6G1LC00_9PEZI|nr:hypothetical protein EJ03DRAFT_350683 [Teratosphaeria nubilosa]